MEHSSAEICATAAAVDPPARGRSFQHVVAESKVGAPRPGEVLREIALVLAAHIAAVTVILLASHWLGIH